MHLGVFVKLFFFVLLVALFFGRPIGAVIRAIRRRPAPPPPRQPPRPPRGRKVRASEDIVDAEIISERQR